MTIISSSVGDCMFDFVYDCFGAIVLMLKALGLRSRHAGTLCLSLWRRHQSHIGAHQKASSNSLVFESGTSDSWACALKVSTAITTA